MSAQYDLERWWEGKVGHTEAKTVKPSAEQREAFMAGFRCGSADGIDRAADVARQLLPFAGDELAKAVGTMAVFFQAVADIGKKEPKP